MPNVDSSSDHTWQTTPVRVRGDEVLVAHRPGLPGAGPADVAQLLLSEHVQVERSDAVAVLNSGAGLVGVVVARLTDTPVALADPHIVSVEAARRTAAANGCPGLAVHHSQGISHWQPERPADVVAARLPKGHHPALQTIWDAWRVLRPGGRFYLAGAHDEGLRSYLRHTGDLFGRCATLAYRKGHRVGVAVKETEGAVPPAFQEAWLDHEHFHRFEVVVRSRSYAVCSRPGVFSWDRLDRGTEVLLEAIEIAPGETVVDIGCGYGIAGVVAAETAGQVYLVDADITAVESARRTVALHGLENCRVLPGDGLWSLFSGNALEMEGTSVVGEAALDVAVTNPPFHQGKATTYDTARQFIRDAARVLRPGGRFYLVANRFLRYEDAIAAAFGTIETVYADNRFKVLRGIL